MENPESNNLEFGNQRAEVPSNPRQLENMLQLLHTGTDENIELVLELLMSGGVTKELFSAIFAIALIHHWEHIRIKAAQVLHQGASAETKAFLDAKLRDVLKMEYLNQELLNQ